MKLEQLNKHEELSYIEDAEVNEAILKNTISKDELCRYLSPLKFMEIETWRKEVPFGDDLDESEVEHRKWRTPIEILLPTAGKDEDGSSSSQEANEAKIKEDSGRKKKAVSAYSRRRKFFEDVQRQNAEVLRRSNSDAMKTTRQPQKEASSSGEKSTARQRNPGQTEGERSQNTTEHLLRTAYAPANPIPPIKESATAKGNRNAGHIHVNQTADLPLTHVTVMTSYFAPGKPVPLSRARRRAKPEPLRRHSAENGESKRQNSNNGTPPSSSQKVSSASWPRPTNENNLRQLENTDVREEVQVLPFNVARPQTVGEQFVSGRYETFPRHQKFRGSPRNLGRGWRTWNNRRTIESSFNAATKLYQSSVVPKKSHPSRILGKIRGIRTANGTRDALSSTQHRRANSSDRMGESKNNNPGGGEDTPTATKDNSLSNHVTKISYSISRSQENFLKASQKSRVTSVPPIDIKVASCPHIPKNFSYLSETPDTTSKNGLRYLNADGVIELPPVPNGSAPWVDETFCPSLAMNDSYYLRHQRPTKTVTFRLGAT